MPTVLRIGGYRFHFYSHEPGEPPHIHIEYGDGECKSGSIQFPLPAIAASIAAI